MTSVIHTPLDDRLNVKVQFAQLVDQIWPFLHQSVFGSRSIRTAFRTCGGLSCVWQACPSSIFLPSKFDLFTVSQLDAVYQTVHYSVDITTWRFLYCKVRKYLVELWKCSFTVSRIKSFYEALLVVSWSDKQIRSSTSSTSPRSIASLHDASFW